MLAIVPTLAAIAAAVVAGFLVGSGSIRTKLRRMRAELADIRRLAERDPLTGLPNRSGVQRHHRQEVAAGRAHSAVLLDLDRFKAINDTWGHQAGDAHLISVAERLAAACLPIGAMASRLAGDEFLLLVPETNRDTLVKQVAAILAALAAPLRLPAEDAATITVTPSASAGIALPGPGSTWTDLLRRADIALYHAKTLRGRVVLHTAGMRHPTRRGSDSGAERLRDRHADQALTAGADVGHEAA
jgi:diguanylate cyclase (GGDEF)-like protein